MQLKEIRKSLGITQKELADELAVSVPQISRYERGETAMTPDTIIKICNYLGITSDRLLGYTPEPTYPTPHNFTYIQENEQNSIMEYTKNHLHFLENKIENFHTNLQDANHNLNLIFITVEKLCTELQELELQYNRIQKILEQLSKIHTKDKSEL